MRKVQLKIKNFPKQQAIFDSRTRYKVVAKGRRFGLTKGAANNFIIEALKGDFKQGLWIDTVNANIDRYVERYFLPHLQNLPQDIPWKWRKQNRILNIANAYIDFRSADRPENIEGFGYDKAFLNEAGIILKSEYLWLHAIRPMLWEFKPITVIGGTPKVGAPAFKELAERGKDKTQPEYEFFHYTSFDNPYLDTTELEQEIKSMPERVVQQEVYAQFLEDTGVVFRGVEAVAVAKPSKPLDNHLYVMGVDLAKVEDWTVIVVYDRRTNQQVYQDRFQNIEWPFQKKKIIAVAKHYNNALIYLDATGVGDPIADDLIRSGVAVEPFKFTNQSKKEIVEKLVIWIEQKKIRILNIEDSITEFNIYTYDISNTGKIRYNAPVGFHDDIVMAHALAIHGLQPIPTPRPQAKQTRVQAELKRLSKNYGKNEIQEYEYQAI